MSVQATALKIRRYVTGAADPLTGTTVAAANTFPFTETITGVNISSSDTNVPTWLRLSAAPSAADAPKVIAGRYVYVGGEIRQIKSVTSDLKMIELFYALLTPITVATQLLITPNAYFRSVVVTNSGGASGLLNNVAFASGAIISYNNFYGVGVISYDATGTTFTFEGGI